MIEEYIHGRASVGELLERIEQLEKLVVDLHNAIYNYVSPEGLRDLDERVGELVG